MLSISEAGIISTTLQGLFQGISSSCFRSLVQSFDLPTFRAGVAVVVYALTVFILTRGGRQRRLNISMLAASTTLMVLSTTVCPA